jgi:hypothetical protein
MTRHFNDSEKAKIKQIINDGVSVTLEINTLKEGLNDTVKHIADELDIKPTLLKKAIRIAAKSDHERQKEEFDELEAILETVAKHS